MQHNCLVTCSVVIHVRHHCLKVGYEGLVKVVLSGSYVGLMLHMQPEHFECS